MNEIPTATDARIHVSWQQFGEVLHRIRVRLDLSQERLADLLGCDRTYIWRLEHGRNRPSRIFLHHLKNMCALSPQDARILLSFVLLREYRCDKLEVIEADLKKI